MAQHQTAWWLNPLDLQEEKTLPQGKETEGASLGET